MKSSSLILFAAILVLQGCGGSSSSTDSSPRSAQGTLTLKIKWPARNTRLIPYDSSSIVATLTDSKNAVIGTQTLPRPAQGTLTTSVSFTDLQPAALTLTATAYPTAGGTGVAEAVGQTPVAVVSGKNTPVTVTMADTIVSLQISAGGTVYSNTNPISIKPASTLKLTETAFDAASDVVLTSPTTILWKAGNANATVGLTGVMTAVTTGTSTVTVTEKESGVSTTVGVNINSSTPTATYPGFSLADPTGTHLYVLAEDAIHVFAIGSNGQLTFLQQIAAPNVNTQTSHAYITATMTPDGKHIYVYGYDPGTPGATAQVDLFNIQNDGTLASAGSPISEGIYAQSLTCDASSHFLYVDSEGLVYQFQTDIYTIGADGSLTLAKTVGGEGPTYPESFTSVPGTKYMVGSTVDYQQNLYLLTMTVNNDGTLTNTNEQPLGATQNDFLAPYIFASSSQMFTFSNYKPVVASFAISGAGLLTPGTTASVAGNTSSGAVGYQGKYLYARSYGAGASQEIIPFSIASGTLSPLSPTATSLPDESFGSVVSTPNGNFVYTTNPGDDSISEFSTNSNGSLTPLNPPKVTG